MTSLHKIPSSFLDEIQLKKFINNIQNTNHPFRAIKDRRQQNRLPIPQNHCLMNTCYDYLLSWLRRYSLVKRKNYIKKIFKNLKTKNTSTKVIIFYYQFEIENLLKSAWET